MRKIFPNVKGAESAKAHGQAIINTAVKTFKALLESVKSQKPVEMIAIDKMAIVKYLLILLVIVVKDSSLSVLKTSLLHNCVK